MVIAAIVLAGLLVFVVRMLRARKERLSGLVATRPQFMVEPPARRVSQRGRF